MKMVFFGLTAIIMSSHLQAQDSTSRTLDEVVVTANKFEQKQSTTGKVVTVITQEQIQKSGGKTISQILNEQAGITINGAYNAPGSVQTVFMRGASSGRTLILMDGIPVSDPSMINNEFDLNLFSITDVERIEICKGAQSTLYGSDAIAGVINIITVKKDIRKAFNVKASTIFGNRNTTRNNVQVYGKAGKLTYTTRFAKLNTDGFSAAYDESHQKHFDRDGYDGNIINASLNYQVVPALAVKGFIQHSQYKAGIDGGVFADDRDYTIRNKNLASGVGAVYKKGIVNVSANYQYGELSRNYLNDSLDVPGSTKFESNRYGGRTQFAELYGSVAAAKWLTVLVGGDYRWANMHQEYFSLSIYGPYSSSFPDTALHQSSYYASLLFNALQKRFNLEIGGRTNKHSRYGTNSTYTINPSFTITKNWRVFGSVASGFKAPSIFQLFDAFSGNPGLMPEKSVNYEGGVQFSHEKISARAVYFHRIIRNGIDYNYITFQYFNFVKQTVDGLELEVTAHPVKALSITANYTLLSGKEQTQSRKDYNDTSYNYLLRRPKNTLNATIGYQVTPALYVSVGGKTVSKRYDVGGYQVADVLLDKYFLLNAYAEYKVNDNLRFFVDGQNLTDKKFFEIRGYNAIPLLVSGGVTFNW
jgi:vitamin B12 transporter